MKKAKIITIVILVVAVCALCGVCSYRCTHKKVDYRATVNSNFNIDIPKEWECVYYNQGDYFNGEGTKYYVFKTTERDEEFFKDFSTIPNAEFEKAIAEEKNIFDKEFFNKHIYIDSEYLYDLSKPYEWYKKEVREPRTKIVTALREAKMIYQSQRLYIFSAHFKVDPTPDELESLSSSEKKLPYKKVY